MNVTIWSFVTVLALTTASGAMSIVKKRKTTEDYLVASRRVKPWLTALSTVATNNSGFMFIGLISYTYRFGIEAIWLMFGWVIGDLIAWIWVHPRVREVSGQIEARTIPVLIGSQDRGSSRPLIIASGLVTLVFLGIYAAAQLKAGSTALHAVFEWPMYVGTLVGAAIVILYSYAGGIRADIWTDAAQSFVMLVAMSLILIAGYLKIGGLPTLLENLGGQEAQLLGLFPEDLAFGAAFFVAGYLFAGLGTVGQPHLMTRLMGIESVDAIRRARIYYIAWYFLFFALSIGVGLYCRAIIPDLTELPIAQEMSNPTQLALPLVTMRLLPDVIVGVALAGLFAATVSTADSQIIVCSGTLTQEITRRWRDSYMASKIGTFLVTAVALAIALFAPQGVFSLVIIAWSAMGATLGPVVVLRVFRMPLSPAAGVTMIAASLGTVAIWQIAGLREDTLPILPGIVVAALVYLAFRIFGSADGSASAT